ncbi:adenosine deaminase [Planctomycetota bacterium]
MVLPDIHDQQNQILLKTMERLISTLRKGELHVHLNGLVAPQLIQELLGNGEVTVPDDFDLSKDLTRNKPAKNLAEYFKPWQVLRLVPQSRAALRMIVLNAFESLRKQNTSFVELRNSVIYISRLNGIGVDEALHWLIQEIESASEHFSITSGLIMTVSRGDHSCEDLRTLLKAYTELGRPKTVIGLDLAGNEDIGSPSDLAGLFRRARDVFDLKITIHAGETGKVENIVDAIRDYGADRIGHGTAAGDSLETMELLRESDVCVEVCPISNRLTGALSEEESHPLVEFIKHDVPFVVCSDNPCIHNSSPKSSVQRLLGRALAG